MPTTVASLTGSEVAPTGYAQFGTRGVLCFSDNRPQVIMPGTDGSLTCYDAGIKPPITAPSIASGAAATNFRGTTKVWAAYSYYSTHRNLLSAMSPVVELAEITDLKVTVNGFAAPRDSYLTQDIDAVVVAIQYRHSSGLLCLLDQMKVDCSDGNFAAKSIILDISQQELEHGFRLDSASMYLDIPPAVMYVAQHGERLWYGGQTQEVEDADVSVTLDNVTWRGKAVCRVTLNQSISGDQYLYRAFYTEGNFIGFVWDTHSATVFYCDRETTAALDGATKTGAIWKGHRDRIWPSSFTGHAPGGLPVSRCECVGAWQYFSMPALADQGCVIHGLSSDEGGMLIVTDSAPIRMTGGYEPNRPEPTLTRIKGGKGAVATRGVAYSDAQGETAWMSWNGPMLYSGGQVIDVATQAGCLRLFRGEEWIDSTSLANSVACPLRDYDGYIFGRISIAGTANYWLVYTTKPQVGFWLMDGIEMRSNLLEYQDDYKRSCVLVGDSTTGRVVRLLSPGILTDLDGSDVATAYTWEYRGGWDSNTNARRRPVKAFTLPGLIAPSGTLTITGTLWRSDMPFRHHSDIDSNQTSTTSITENNLLLDHSFSPASKRFHSIALSGSSTTGTSSGKSWRPLEIARWELVYEEEKKGR